MQEPDPKIVEESLAAFDAGDWLTPSEILEVMR